MPGVRNGLARTHHFTLPVEGGDGHRPLADPVGKPAEGACCGSVSALQTGWSFGCSGAMPALFPATATRRAASAVTSLGTLMDGAYALRRPTETLGLYTPGAVRA